MILDANHPAVWTVRQLLSRSPTGYLTFRAIHFEPSKQRSGLYHAGQFFSVETIFFRSVKVSNFWNEWKDWLRAALNQFNSESRPTTIFVACNGRSSAYSPRTAKERPPFDYWNICLRLSFRKGFDREKRLLQIQMWREHGLPPSFVSDYGSGLCAVWCFRDKLNQKMGIALDRHMRELSSADDFAKHKSYFDSDLMPLPGFIYHVPSGLYPPQVCGITQPESYFTTEAHKLDLEAMAYFPRTSLEDLNRYFSLAQAMPGDVKENMKTLMRQSARQLREQGALTLGKVISEEQHGSMTRLDTAKGRGFGRRIGTWKLDRERIPHLHDIKWMSKMYWARKYCACGYSSLSLGEIDQIGFMLKIPRPARETIEDLIMLHFVKRSFTLDAVLEFCRRPEVRFLGDFTDKQIEEKYFNALSYLKASLSQFYGRQWVVACDREIRKALRARKKIKNLSSFRLDGADRKK